MKRTNYLAFGLLAIIALWMLSGVWASDSSASKQEDTAQQKPDTNTLRVNVKRLTGQEVNREIAIQGELEPFRQVVVRAKTTSSVVSIIADKGQRVKRHEPVLWLDSEDRTSQQESAKAALANAQLELDAARKLSKNGLQSDNLVKAAKAAVAQAKANLARVDLDVKNLQVAAPFEGVIETREVEIGSRVDQGDSLFTIVDESMVKAVGFVPQQDITKLQVGQRIEVTLLDARKAEGKISFIARVGDAETHSFRVEAEIPNPNNALNAGTSVKVEIATGKELAHFLPPSVFALNDTGEMGVKTVGDNNQVEFHPVAVIRSEARGFWVSGLPKEVDVITLGQGFAIVGETVIPVPSS